MNNNPCWDECVRWMNGCSSSMLPKNTLYMLTNVVRKSRFWLDRTHKLINACDWVKARSSPLPQSLDNTVKCVWKSSIRSAEIDNRSANVCASSQWRLLFTVRKPVGRIYIMPPSKYHQFPDRTVIVYREHITYILLCHKEDAKCESRKTNSTMRGNRIKCRERKKKK